jgi:hypothetical protein
MEGSNDGVTWDTLDTVSSETGWSDGEIRTYTCDVATTAYCMFRLNVTAIQTGGDLLLIGELYLIGDADATRELTIHDMTTNSSHAPQVASASTHFGTFDAFQVFDGNADFIHPWVGTNTGVDWIKVDFGPGVANVASGYRVLGPAGYPLRAPKNWTFQGSTDNLSWDTLDTQTNQTAWLAGEIRFFPITPGLGYRYFRLNITANNNSGGDAAYTEIAEFYIIGTIGAAPSSTARGYISGPGWAYR